MPRLFDLFHSPLDAALAFLAQFGLADLKDFARSDAEFANLLGQHRRHEHDPIAFERVHHLWNAPSDLDYYGQSGFGGDEPEEQQEEELEPADDLPEPPGGARRKIHETPSGPGAVLGVFRRSWAAPRVVRHCPVDLPPPPTPRRPAYSSRTYPLPPPRL